MRGVKNKKHVNKQIIVHHQKMLSLEMQGSGYNFLYINNPNMYEIQMLLDSDGQNISFHATADQSSSWVCLRRVNRTFVFDKNMLYKIMIIIPKPTLQTQPTTPQTQTSMILTTPRPIASTTQPTPQMEVDGHQKKMMPSSSLPSLDYFDVVGHGRKELEFHSLHTLGIYTPITIIGVFGDRNHTIKYYVTKNSSSHVSPQYEINPLKFDTFQLTKDGCGGQPSFEDGTWYRIVYRHVGVDDPEGVSLRDLYEPLFDRSVRKELFPVVVAVPPPHDQQPKEAVVDETTPVLTAAVGDIRIADHNENATTTTRALYTPFSENTLKIIMGQMGVSHSEALAGLIRNNGDFEDLIDEEKDILLIMGQVGVSRSSAIAALVRNNNDVVESIMDLKGMV